jgi:hypothetical protein
MKASPLTPPVTREPALFTPPAGPKCEVLFDIFQGELGRVHLGRMLSGSDAGRLVALRKLPAAPSRELETAVEQARAVAHPKLAKTLGVLRAADSWYLASEYIPGVALSELGQALVSHDERLDAAVAARVTLDTLNAAIAARDLLPSAARCVFPESIWVAEFGETFLSEVLASAVLAKTALGGVSEPPPGDTPDSRDVRAAGLQLLELACGATGASALAAPDLPEALREIAARATSLRGAPSYPSLHAFADALAALGPALIASDEEVSGELRRLLGSLLDTRRQKLSMTERVSLQEGEQDETKFFRAASVTAQRDTARPPAEAELAGAHSSKYRIPPRSEPPEDPTTVFRVPGQVMDSSPEITLERFTAPAEPAVQPSEATPPSLAPAPLDSGRADQAARSATVRRLAVVLVLFAAVIAFGLTSGSGNYASAVHSGASWLAGTAAKLAHFFR